ncbi:type II secretion system protein GspC [Oceanicoccus sp. KOV_DT_Chl]|uniref:type II secretion system protein GspC n=1 Tax=Oceanicoccus sp. KOV_DT_Chl TaxID=1904639 RepID=UPI0011AF1BE9|nr:type II secretion system protein GspC [Oceanicoccus sp. KOV_DT_Chl]
MTAEHVTARLTSMAQQLAGTAAALPSKQIHNAFCAVIGIWLLVVLVQLATVLISSPANEVSVVPDSGSVVVAPVEKSVDVAKLQALDLFGQVGSLIEPVVNSMPSDEVEIDAAVTKLNLTLEGIVHTPDATGSVAVIVYQGKQDQYAVGDKLPVGNKVVLAKVLLDHVILDNVGSYESLWLYAEEKSNGKSTPSVVTRINKRPGVTDKRNDTKATDLAADYRDRLYKNPSSLAEVLRISPAQRDGQMVGYRVSPGRDRQQFSRLGFKTNDIVTSINGIELNEPSKALEIYKLMRTATQASFVVDRNGASVEVLVALEE